MGERFNAYLGTSMPARQGIGVKRRTLSGALLAAALLPPLAFGALGEPESTVAADAQQLNGSIKSTERTNYRIHEIHLSSGVRLREFAAVGGNVFAVAWSGPAIPDLRQALGRYFDVYMTAAKASRRGRRPLQIQQSDFVMQSGGHMRAFTGRAYLPQFLPAGASVEELR